MLEGSWSVSMRIALSIKIADNSIVVLELFFSMQALLKNRGDVLTPKIVKSRLGSGRPVRPGPRDGLTGCLVAGLARRGQEV
jgi:hypothetical protein